MKITFTVCKNTAQSSQGVEASACVLGSFTCAPPGKVRQVRSLRFIENQAFSRTSPDSDCRFVGKSRLSI